MTPSKFDLMKDMDAVALEAERERARVLARTAAVQHAGGFRSAALQVHQALRTATGLPPGVSRVFAS
jgi:hypothetical protein